MSKRSKAPRRKRRKATLTLFRKLLSKYDAPSLIRLIEAASVSPMAAHRAPSLGRLYTDTIRLWPNGPREATPRDLPALVAATRARSPDLSIMEDCVPLDPRLEVLVDWNDNTFRLLPGSLERPVAMFQRARLVHRATAETLLNHLGFSVDDVAQFVLARLDAAANNYAEAWPQDSARPSPSDPPVLSERELEATRQSGDVSALVTDPVATPRLARALAWATRDLDSLEFSAHDPSSMFGPTLAVQAPAQLCALPSGFWSDSFESSLIELAHRAAEFDQTSSRLFRAESERALKLLFRMSPLEFVGPFSDDSDILSAFALLVDERTVVLFDLVAVLDSTLQFDLSERFERLRRLGPGTRLSGASGHLVLHEDTHLARVLILSAAGHVMISGSPGVAAASLDDLRWIVSKTRESHDDVFFFFDELANGGQEIFAFETINTFEHWRANGKCLSREGQAWDMLAIPPHWGNAEWADAATLTPLRKAMRSMQFSPLHTWDGYDQHFQWPTCSFGKFPNGPFWDLRFVPPLVAIQCFGPSTPQQACATLVNLASDIHWKVERSNDLQSILLPLASAAGIRVIFVPLAKRGTPPLRFVEANASAVVIGWTQDVAKMIGRDDAAAEAAIGEALAEGCGAIAAAGFRGFDRPAFIRAWASAPPGLRSTAIQVPVGNNERPEPTGISEALMSLAQRELAKRLKKTGVKPGRYDASTATQLESDRIAPILRTMLSEAMSRFDHESLLMVAMRELERSLCAKWFQEQKRRQNERFPVLAYDPIEHELSEGSESERLTRVVTLLVEESLATAASGGRDSVTRLAWMQLLAVAALLLESYIRSESNHYGLIPAITVIDLMFGVRQKAVADATLFDQASFAKARARSKIDSAVAPTFEARTMDQQQSILTRLDDALFDAIGFHLNTLEAVLDIGRTWAVDPGEDVAEITIEQFRARCADRAPERDLNEATTALNYLTLRSEQIAGQIEHWERERRPIRLMTRPFVRRSADSLYVLPWQCEGSQRVLSGYLSQGRLIWLEGEPPAAVRSVLDELRESRNKSLELEAEHVSLRATPFVRRNIKKAKSIGLSDLAWAGEIDCIAIVEARSLMLVMDAKDAFLTFSPTTIARSIRRFNGPGRYVDKLLKKVAAISTDPNAVATALGVGTVPREWSVQPLMVTRHVEPAAFTRDQQVPFCTISELEQVLIHGA